MPLLGTKLRVPRPRRQLVPRGRLTDQLLGRPGAVPRLVLVAAPAGFGKTTLLTQWLGSAGTSSAGADDDGSRVAWLSLDAADADLRHFLADLVAAVRSAAPEVGTEAMALLDADRAAAGRRRPGRPRSTTSTRCPARPCSPSTTTTSSTRPRSTRR